MKHVIVVSHGSRSEKTIEEIQRLVDSLREKNQNKQISFAFLEFDSPSIPDAIEASIKAEANEVLILLNFLNAGKHVDEDIPKIVKIAQEKYPQVMIQLSQPVGQHYGIVALFNEMIN